MKKQTSEFIGVILLIAAVTVVATMFVILFGTWISAVYAPFVDGLFRVMDSARAKALELGDDRLTYEEMAEGWHFCPDWDYMLVGPESPENDGCTCNKTTGRKYP